MRRWLLTVLFGPRCDAYGCLNAGTMQTTPIPPGWRRGFRWCSEHRENAERTMSQNESVIRATPRGDR